jgi:hypothetical protein
VSAVVGTDTGASGPALGGRDGAAFEKLKVAFSQLQEEEVFARQQVEDLRAETTEAQEEAAKYEKQVTDLQALREKERVLASRAVADVKVRSPPAMHASKRDETEAKKRNPLRSGAATRGSQEERPRHASPAGDEEAAGERALPSCKVHLWRF